MPMRLLISLLILTFCTVTAQGRMYRWVDENGITVYSQSPPLGGENATRIKPPPSPSTSENNAWKKVNKMWQKSSDLKEDRQIEADKKADGKATNQVKRKNCAAAKRNLEVLQTSPRALIKTPDGEYHRYSEEERQEKIEQARAQVTKHCL